jgi:hypothetical protein
VTDGSQLPLASPALSPGSVRRLIPSLPMLAGLFAFSVAGLRGQSLLNDPDTYLHIAAGKWMLSNWALPTSDPFSHSMPGAHWIVHEWLAELLMGATFSISGWHGVVLLTAGCFGLSIALLAQYLIERGEAMTSLVVAICAGALLEPHLVARPHMLAMPVMVAWCRALVTSREKNDSPSFTLLPLILVWANLHGSFMVGLGLSVFLGLETAIEQQAGWLTKFRQWTVFTFVAVLIAMLNPNGIQAFLLPIRFISMSVLHDSFTEWMSVNFHTPQPLELWLLGLIFAGYGLNLKLPIWRLLFVIGLIHMALQSMRHGDLLAILAPLLAWPSLGPQLRARMTEGGLTIVGQSFAALARASTWLGYVSAAGIAGVMCAASVVKPLAPVDSPSTPVSATAAAIGMRLTGPVFNGEGFGGFLIFNKIRTFIDGRIEMYGDDYLARYLAAERGDESSLSSMITNYHIEWTMLPPQSGAALLLKHFPGWERVYADQYAVIDRKDSNQLTRQ